MPVSFFCANCGNQLPEGGGARFCPSCGAPVLSSTAKTSPTSVQRSFTVTGRAKVIAKVDVPGSIDVTKGRDGEVTIDAKVTEPDLIDFEIAQSGNVVTVKSRTKSWNPVLWGSYLLSTGPRTSVSVAVPQQTDLDLETSMDQIKVEGISGTISADSKTGAIQLSECSGVINATSHTGSVNLDDVNGTLTVRATTGPTRFAGDLSNNVSTFRSTTGAIDMTLAGEQNLTIDASTTVGQVVCILDLKDSRYEKGEYIGRHVSGKLGTGAGHLSIETTVGSISIHR